MTGVWNVEECSVWTEPKKSYVLIAWLHQCFFMYKAQGSTKRTARAQKNRCCRSTSKSSPWDTYTSQPFRNQSPLAVQHPLTNKQTHSRYNHNSTIQLCLPSSTTSSATWSQLRTLLKALPLAQPHRWRKWLPSCPALSSRTTLRLPPPLVLLDLGDRRTRTTSQRQWLPLEAIAATMSRGLHAQVDHQHHPRSFDLECSANFFVRAPLSVLRPLFLFLYCFSFLSSLFLNHVPSRPAMHTDTRATPSRLANLSNVSNALSSKTATSFSDNSNKHQRKKEKTRQR